MAIKISVDKASEMWLMDTLINSGVLSLDDEAKEIIRKYRIPIDLDIEFCKNDGFETDVPIVIDEED